MKILSMPVIRKSRKVIFVNSNMMGGQVSLPKRREIFDQMENEEDGINITSIHDRYASRPSCLEEMCLTTFSVNYKSSLVKPAQNGNNETTNRMFRV